jgi:hypothetical protein
MKPSIPSALLLVLAFAPNSTAHQIVEPPTPLMVEEIVEPAPAPEPVDKIGILIDAIEQFEGYYLGSRAHTNNNPCNLRWSKYQSGKLAGFSYFDSYAVGRKACRHQITIAADGRSSVYYPEMTLLQFFNVYAPPSDNNQPNVYHSFVLRATQFDENTRMRDLLPE